LRGHLKNIVRSEIMKRRKLVAILNLVGFIAMVAVNALAVILPINGLDTGEISDLYSYLHQRALLFLFGA